MRILAIETSCDETAIAILECTGLSAMPAHAGQAGDETSAQFRVLGNALLSQVDIHKEYGGVFPALAKREHAKNLVPILEAALEEAELLHEDTQVITEETRANIADILAREPGLAEQFFAFASECEPPAIDAIAVTAGPGLEPALWVGINFAKALALLWNKPLVAVNHMEGHVIAALASRNDVAAGTAEHDAGAALASGNHAVPHRGDHGARADLAARKVVGDREQVVADSEILEIENVQMPILALLISGGHTELVLMKKWIEYELIGQTRDDAVGEAFDKVARMLALPYPGGPEISKLAESVRTSDVQVQKLGHRMSKFRLPRPMIHSNTCDFSFAGLKTAVLHLLKEHPNMSDEEKKHVAHEFENAVADVLWKKTSQALEETNARTLVIGGGVSANTHIRRVFTENIQSKHPEVTLRIPAAALTTDNAVMIGLAGFYRALRKEFATDIIANGNLPLA